MTTMNDMGTMFEQGKLTPELDALYVHHNTPTGTTSPSVVTNPNRLTDLLESMSLSTSNPFDWFTKGSLSALEGAEALLSEVYGFGDRFTGALTGEVRNAKGEVTKAKGAYANLAKTLALAGALGGGYSYLSNKKEQLEDSVPQRTVNAKKTKPKPKGKGKSKPRRRL